MPDERFLGLDDDQNRYVMDRLREFIPPAQYAQAKSVLLRFHNQLHADGDINRFDIHEGEKKSVKKKRGGISYKVKARSAVSLDIEREGLKLIFYRAGQEPYPGQGKTSFTDVNWSGPIFLSQSNLNEALKCSRESAQLAKQRPVKNEPPTPPTSRNDTHRASSAKPAPSKPPRQSKARGPAASFEKPVEQKPAGNSYRARPTPVAKPSAPSASRAPVQPKPASPAGCGCIVMLLLGGSLLPPICYAVSKLL